jgi:hypothetical protein
MAITGSYVVPPASWCYLLSGGQTVLTQYGCGFPLQLDLTAGLKVLLWR